MGKLLRALTVVFLVVMVAGCKTIEGAIGEAVGNIGPGDGPDKMFKKGKFAEYIAFAESPGGPFASKEARRQRLVGIIAGYQKQVAADRQKGKKGGTYAFHGLETYFKDAYQYAYALIEEGQQRNNLFRAMEVSVDGLDECGVLMNLAVQSRPQDAKQALATVIATWMMDESEELTIREQSGKLKQLFAFASWFAKGDRVKSQEFFQESMEAVPPSRVVPYHLRRSAFYQKILGNNKLALREIEAAIAKSKDINFLKFDEENEYNIDAHIRLVDLQLKLGNLQAALDAMKRYQELAEGKAGTWRSKSAGKLATFRGVFTIGHSLAGGTYAAMREFGKAKVEFDKAWSYMRDVEPANRTDFRALATYHTMYGSYYLALQGRIDDAAEEVEQGLKYLKPSYIDSIENNLDMESAYLHAAELNLLRGRPAVAVQQAIRSADLSSRYRNSVVEGNAHLLLGRIAWESGKEDEALRQFEKARKLLEGTENTENWKLYYGLGLVYEGRDNAKAIKYLTQAVSEVEKLWEGRFSDTRKQVSFIDNRLVVFEPLIRILVSQGKAELALTYIERSKSRAFFETSVYAAARQAATVPTPDPEAEERVRLDDQISVLGEKVSSIRDKLTDIEERLGNKKSASKTRGINVKEQDSRGRAATTASSGSQESLSAGERSTLESDRQAHAKALDNVEKKLAEATKLREALGSPIPEALQATDGSQPLAARQIVAMLARDKGTVLLEYYIGENAVVGAAVTGGGVKAVRMLHGSEIKFPIGSSAESVSGGQASSTRGVKVRGIDASATRLSAAKMNDAQRMKSNVNAFYESIYSKNARYAGSFNDVLGAALYKDLVEPFADVLAGAERVVIVPHGALHYLPFQALVVSGAARQSAPEQLLEKERVLLAQAGSGAGMNTRGVGVKALPSVKQAELVAVRRAIRAARSKAGDGAPQYLIDRFPVFYAPSATVLATVRKRPSAKDPAVLAIGSPPELDVSDLEGPGPPLEKLESAREEILEVKSIFGEKAVAFTDAAATKGRFASLAPGKDILLMSTHGMLMRNDPMKSIVFFAPSTDGQDKGRLTVGEIESMKFGPALVVMSACETGLVGGYDSDLGKELQDVKFPKGDDLVGLQRAFIRAGASTVMSTLWQVEDAATKKFVLAFFTNYRNTKDKARSLQQAALAVRNAGNESWGVAWSHPYFWSSFVLSGNWE